MNDKTNFANQFIDLWQENFEKMLSNDANMRQMQQIFEGMKGFYAKSENESASATNSDAHGNGDAYELFRAISRRLDELEQRIADIERASR